jgi:hypothetical protein
MNPRIAEILAELKRLEDELENEVVRGRVLRGFSVEGKRITFEKKPAACIAACAWG